MDRTSPFLIPRKALSSRMTPLGKLTAAVAEPVKTLSQPGAAEINSMARLYGGATRFGVMDPVCSYSRPHYIAVFYDSRN